MEFLQQNWQWAALAAVSGGMLLFSMMRGGGKNTLSAVEATLKINREDAVIIDVRTADEFGSGHIPNARHIPLADLERRAPEIAKSGKPVILCCATGARSAAATDTLQKAGIESVFNLTGGMQAWQQAGQPVSRKRK